MLFEGQDLLQLDDAGIRAIRGDRIAMIFQEPMSSLNPALTVGLQVGEPLNLHRRLPWGRALEKVEGAADYGRDPRRSQPAGRLSAPVLRRDAAAGDDRDGARLQAEAADR